jgi:DNA invertase Pin-like site-specific DNA recombinase
MFRSLSDAVNTIERCHEDGVKIILSDLGDDPVMDSIFGKAMCALSAIFAEMERERIRERVMDGKRGKRAKGGHVGGLAPYGYRIVGEGREAALVPHEQEIVLVGRMMTMRKSGVMLKDIKAKLDEDGDVTRAGTPFSIEQIRRIVIRA